MGKRNPVILYDVSNTLFDDFSDPSREEIDWIQHEAGIELTLQEVDQRVRALRQAGTRLVDTVPPGLPALESRCDL